MNVFRKAVTWLVLGIVFLPLPPNLPAPAQEAAKPPAQGQDAPAQTFKPEELEALVAPIALHPDALLAQILMASTYPLEIVQATRFVKDNPNLKGDQINEALKKYSWDDSVKSMIFFPQVLAMMNEKLDWLQKLGDAFLAQQRDVMAAIQRLRARAQASGQLKSSPEQNVIVEPAASPPTEGAAPPPPPAGAPPAPPPPSTVVVTESAPTVIRIEPTNPEVIHVPSYNPTVVYGAWPPAYPAPYYPYPPGYFAAGAFTFAAGMAVGAAVWGNANWHGGDVDINTNRSNNFTRNVNNTQTAQARINERQTQRQSGGAGANRPGGGDRSGWNHNPEHRKGVQYRDNATQQRFNKTGPANAQARESFRGRTEGGSAGQGGRGQGGLGEGGRGQGGGFGDRGAGGFSGAGGGGRDAQSFSNRGNASRESFNRSAGGSGGARSGGGGARAGGGGGGGARGGGGGGGRGGGRR